MAAPNPYLESFRELFPDKPSWEHVEKLGPGKVRRIREDFCRRYSWAIPNDHALECIAKYAPIVEMGAGAGYWAHLLQERGVDVSAFDAHSRVSNENRLSPAVGSWEQLEKFSHHSLFLCWPPLNDDMAAKCLEVFKGEYLIYVGEAAGGCTADDHFFEILRQSYTLKERIQIPSWPGIDDSLWVYERAKTDF